MRTKLFFAFVAVLFAATFASCSDDDEQIYFSEDQIVGGDILTGNYNKIGNSLTLYAGRSWSINVHGCSGGVKAVSVDENVATVAIQAGAYSDGHYCASINGVGVGTTTILFTDNSGKSATLTVTVEEYNFIIEERFRRASAVDDVCTVEGVTDAEAAVIKAEVIAKHAAEEKFILEYDDTPECDGMNVYYHAKYKTYDADDNLLYETTGLYSGDGKISFYDDNSGTFFIFYESSDQTGRYLYLDFTQSYLSKYPNIKSVALKIYVEEDVVHP